MAVESIGTLVPTKIPGYADAADIQAALRAYHYGSYTFDINESNAANLINPSIAYTINNLQSQITAATEDYIDEDILTAKGSLVTASAASVPVQLTVGSNGQVLSANSSTATGLEWINPITDSSTNTLTNKTIGSTGLLFEGSTSDDFETLLTVTDPTADRTITFPDVTGTVALMSQVINNTLTTTTGDMIYASADNTPARLAIGTEGEVLTIEDGIPVWAAGGSGGAEDVRIETIMGVL